MSLPQLGQWSAARGLTVQDYFAHLQSDSTADGMEFWLALLTVNSPVNIVMENEIWSSARGGIDFFISHICFDKLWCLPGWDSDDAGED